MSFQEFGWCGVPGGLGFSLRAFWFVTAVPKQVLDFAMHLVLERDEEQAATGAIFRSAKSVLIFCSPPGSKILEEWRY